MALVIASKTHFSGRKRNCFTLYVRKEVFLKKSLSTIQFERIGSRRVKLFQRLSTHIIQFGHESGIHSVLSTLDDIK